MVQNIKIGWIAAGPSAAHCLAGGIDGKLFAWGRNEVLMLSLKEVLLLNTSVQAWLIFQSAFMPLQKGQLGHGDTAQRNLPTEVAALKNEVIIAGK